MSNDSYFGRTYPPDFDSRDADMLRIRQGELDVHKGPRVGDFVVFGDGTTRRISHHWGDRVQTSDGGSFYLGREGWVSFSGSLYSGIPVDALEDRGETRHGDVWFFHHDWATAHNGVHTTAVFRVYYTELEPTR